ncbi:MAG: arylsulfatase, partial [Aeromicrobium sp.]
MTERRDQIQREVLPIPDRPPVGLTTFDAKDPDTVFAPITPLRPPGQAPNVMVVLIDDAGFGSSSVFGGPTNTPTFDRLAAGGLRYSRFHTTALCSPTRAALLSGRNHHSVGMGGITEIATGAPGYCSLRPNTCAPLAETLKLNGYATAQFGKCHEVPTWESSPMGPFDNWPTGGGGFEHFYGFIGGETNQYSPAIYSGTVPVEPDRTPEEGYHFTEDMTDHTIDWVRQQKALMPDKPFFVYYAPGATHAPHHVPVEWSDKYRGKFDQGWDVLREETFARQREAGVIPPDAVLTERPEEIPAWDDMPEDLRPVLARQMEVYAGFLEHTDHHVGRLVDALDDLEVLDDTLIYVIIGDNGASAEGTVNGTFNEMLSLNGAASLETTEFMASRMDLFGTPEAYNHYAVGWAHAMDTPYQWTKQVASHWGGTRNGTIVHWPRGIEA